MLLPVPLLLLAIALLKYLHGDQWLADQLYAWQGHRWTLQGAFVTETLLHRGGRMSSTAAWVMVVLALGWAHIRPRHRSWRGPLLYLASTTLGASTLVAWLKHGSSIHCPWDLVRYGGDHVQAAAAGAMGSGGPGQCFPAGHASAGYAWVALYFVALLVRPSLRWWGLGAGLATGIAFGFTQQLRGAHFLSHDLASLVACWSVAALLYLAWPMRTDARDAFKLPQSEGA